jgi:ribonuclease Z
MQIIFLGSGSGIPTLERNHPSIWLDYRGDRFLWDCGEGTQRQILKAKLPLMKISKIFITHWHADHFAGLLGMIESFNLEGRRKPVLIFGPQANRFIDAISELSYWDFGFDVIAKDIPFEGDEITEIFKTKDYKIFSTPTEHRIPSVGYAFKENDRWKIDVKKAKKFGLEPGKKMKELKEEGEVKVKGKIVKLEDVGKVTKGLKVVYSGDTRPSRNLMKLAEGADLLIHESTFLDSPTLGHSTAKQAARIAKKAKVKKLILTHFSKRYKDTSDFLKSAKEVFPNTRLARDFLKVKV